MWQSVVNGQTLKFHLAGINNQNFIMRDEETGSWWQQITGEAIQGKYRGQKLENVPMDEVTFAVFKRENPDGRVLRPDPKIAAENKYETADWEKEVAKMPVRIDGKLDDALEPRALVVGIIAGGKAKAYPVSALEKQNPIIDTVGGKEIVVILGADRKSVRAFEREADGRELEFFVKPDTGEITDAETASVWDFSGTAVGGPLKGKELKKIAVLKDYWFDWKTYHPDTQLYTLGSR
ncbi:MAG: DUF3179 domain-containing protein [Acidobacteria bacterium]|nr:DUF3179 domain-containing protein [Acidobacteriota bacterium]